MQIPYGAHGLTIEGMPGEEAWVSGGTKLDPIEWKPHNLSNGMNIWKADLTRFKQRVYLVFVSMGGASALLGPER